MSAKIIHTINLFGDLITKLSCTCERCNYTWKPRKINYDRKYKSIKDPVICAKCKSPYWNILRGIRGHVDLIEINE